MKRLILLFASLCLVSCSDDDGDKQKALFVESLTIVSPGGGGGGALEFAYNDERQLKTLSASGTIFTMAYKNGRLSSFASEVNGVEGEVYKFGYDDEGILESLKVNDQEYEVTYDDDDKKYTIEGLDRAFTLNNDNDIISIEQGADEIVFDYEKEGKGPMFNVQGDFYLIAFLLNSPYVMSKRPASEFQSYIATNTFNSDGYLQKAILTVEDEEDPSATIYYNYTEL
jgi:hypothetical protein